MSVCVCVCVCGNMYISAYICIRRDLFMCAYG